MIVSQRVGGPAFEDLDKKTLPVEMSFHKELSRGGLCSVRLIIGGDSCAISGDEKKIQELSKFLIPENDSGNVWENKATVYTLEDLKHKLVDFGNVTDVSTHRFGNEIGDIVSIARRVVMNQSQKEEMMRAKDGVLWKCVDMIPDGQSDGYIYVYTLRDEFKNKEQAMPAYTEASEPNLEWLYGMVGEFSLLKEELEGWDSFEDWVNDREKANDQRFEDKKSEFFLSKLNFAKFLTKLGYQFERINDLKQVKLYLPDHTVLSTRLKKVQDAPGASGEINWSRLRIGSSKGIVTDIEYRCNFLKNDVLLSEEGSSFIHDHLAHVIALLEAFLCYREDKYFNIKEQIKEYFNPIVDKLDQMQEELREGKRTDPSQKDIDRINHGISLWMDDFSTHFSFQKGKDGQLHRKRMQARIRNFALRGTERESKSDRKFKRVFKQIFNRS